MPISRAASLTAISRTAQEQSVDAIRRSLRLLRCSTYPADLPDRPLAGQPTLPGER